MVEGQKADARDQRANMDAITDEAGRLKRYAKEIEGLSQRVLESAEAGFADSMTKLLVMDIGPLVGDLHDFERALFDAQRCEGRFAAFDPNVIPF